MIMVMVMIVIMVVMMVIMYGSDGDYGGGDSDVMVKMVVAALIRHA